MERPGAGRTHAPPPPPPPAVRPSNHLSIPSQNPFRYRRDASALEKTLASLPPLVATAAAAAAVLAAAAAGGAAGRAVAGSSAGAGAKTAATAVAAVAAGAAAVAGVRSADDARARGVAAELYNTLVDAGDPGSLTAADVDALSARTGVDVRARLAAELRSCYDAFLESAIPPGATPLAGNEADRIVAFKAALGVDDEDAAPVHMDVGRRFMRARFEASSRAGDAAGRASLAKLIYVSSLVFGDQKAMFLLPWRRVFDLSDAQLYVAKRDCARGLVKRWIAEHGEAGPGGGAGALRADPAWLADLEAARQRYRLADDVMADEVRAAGRAGLEARLEAALAASAAAGPASLRPPGTPAPGLAQLREAIAYSAALAAAAGGPGAPPGLGPASVAGGKLAEDGPKAAALAGLYRAWLEDALTGPDAAWTAETEAASTTLAAALALPASDAARAREAAASRAYKGALRAEVSSGRLDAAPSKAAVLGALCERLGFDPAAAADMHKAIYRQKVEALLKAAGPAGLSEEDGATLDRLRVLLCVPRADVLAVQSGTAGKAYAAAVAEALASGVQTFSPAAATAVIGARASLRLDPEVARPILAAAARRTFLGFINRSRAARNRAVQGKELRDLVIFSNVVVTPMFRDVCTPEEAEADDRAAALAEAQEAMAKAQADAAKEEAAEKAGKKKEGEEEGEGADAAASPSTPTTPPRPVPSMDTGAVGLSRADEAAMAAAAGGGTAIGAGGTGSAPPVSPDAGARGQTGITLAADLSKEDRLETYRNFLLWCVTGEEVAMPIGGKITVQRDGSEFTRLQQLAGLLGLGPADTAGVQTKLATEAYRNQVSAAVTADGQVPEGKAADLAAAASQLGLSPAQASTITDSVRAERVAGALRRAGDRGALTLQSLLDMKAAGVDLASAASVATRQSLYTAALGAALRDGTGDLSAREWLTDLPATLGLDPAACASAAAGLARDKRRTLLVQAVSHLRQGERAAVAADLNNLLSCARALPADEEGGDKGGKGVLSWGVAAEVDALYGAYAGVVADPAKRAELAGLLGLDASKAAAVEAATVASTDAEEEQEEALF